MGYDVSCGSFCFYIKWWLFSLLSASFWGLEEEREVLRYSPWILTRQVGLFQSCTSEVWLCIRKHLQQVWWNTTTGFLEWWSMSQSCQCLRGIWTTPLATFLTVGQPRRGWAIGKSSDCCSFPWTEVFYSTKILLKMVSSTSITFLDKWFLKQPISLLNKIKCKLCGHRRDRI